MYNVYVESLNKKTNEKETKEYQLGEMDTPEYDHMLGELSDVLFSLDIEFDDVEGDGDMAIDDIMISISEEEDFEKTLDGKKEVYKISGCNK